MSCNFKPNNTDLLYYIRFTRNDQTIMNKLFLSRLLICQYSFHQRRTPLCPLGKKPWCTLDGKLGRAHKMVWISREDKISTHAGESNTDSPVIQSLYWLSFPHHLLCITSRHSYFLRLYGTGSRWSNKYIDWWNIIDKEKPKFSEINLSLCLGWNLGFCNQRLATNHLTHSMASQILVKYLYSTKTGG
jgi:hypothetical protein